ncbi:hypothetical protein CMI47_10740 [Candidatus Pacearchaeota archaeon]|nr:hypothetical protein [Candidatus Pacearchaeota archaeon]|tara:strand:+ start:3063 stop:4862 length:1800 start_codon:yes stop_codon:yes gene_type:complete
MADEQKKIIPIDYTHREFDSIRDDLIEVAERLYPDTFQDFSEASFGAMMVDAVAYVGDQLSFYLDYNVNETFLDTAFQYSNVVRHGRIMGYKYTGRPSTWGQVAMFIKIPASSTGIGPDSAYIPIIKRGSRFTSNTGLNFVLTENVDFADPKNVMVVAQTDASTGAPTYYAIKAYGNVVSGYFGREIVTIGSYERFKRVTLNVANVSEIISVIDTQGHEYFEVDYLAQDMVFKEISNNNYKDDNVPSILKPYLVSRKFVVEKSRDKTALQFGSGDAASSNVVADPQTVALDIFGKDYVTDTTFDPTKLSKDKSYGIVPSNTNLTVIYRVTNPVNSNLAVGNLNKTSAVNLEFGARDTLSAATISTIQSSVEVNNEEPIVGNVTNPTTNEIKRRIYDTFPTQNRAVTQADYENLAYRMPAKFGAIKRCSVQRDPDSMKRNLNMYVLSEDQFGKLSAPNITIKNNLKTWLNHYRMINDTVDILDAYIINFGIEFIVAPSIGVDKYDLLAACINQLKNKFSGTMYYIGEHLLVTQIYSELNKVKGVLDVIKVTITNKNGGVYSSTEFDINSNFSPEGTYIIAPKNCIFELKYPETDIKGKIR